MACRACHKIHIGMGKQFGQFLITKQFWSWKSHSPTELYLNKQIWHWFFEIEVTRGLPEFISFIHDELWRFVVYGLETKTKLVFFWLLFFRCTMKQYCRHFPFFKTCYFWQHMDVLVFHFSKTCYLERYKVVGCKVCGYVWVPQPKHPRGLLKYTTPAWVINVL